jgi:hypothetical protein
VQQRTIREIDRERWCRQFGLSVMRYTQNGGSNRATDFCCSNKFANLSLVELPAATAGLLDIAKLASAGLSKCRRETLGPRLQAPETRHPADSAGPRRRCDQMKPPARTCWVGASRGHRPLGIYTGWLLKGANPREILILYVCGRPQPLLRN